MSVRQYQAGGHGTKGTSSQILNISTRMLTSSRDHLHILPPPFLFFSSLPQGPLTCRRVEELVWVAHLQDAARLQHQDDVRVDDGVEPVCERPFRKRHKRDQTNVFLLASSFPLPLSFPSFIIIANSLAILFLPMRNHQDRGRGKTFSDGALDLCGGGGGRKGRTRNDESSER